MRVVVRQGFYCSSSSHSGSTSSALAHLDHGQYTFRWTAQRALHVFSPGRPVNFDTNSASPGNILAMQQFDPTRNDYSLKFQPLVIARYSFIQLSGLMRHGGNENARISKR